MPIRVLPKDVVDRIAAGEVIERPASVVKELVENALDSGADRVEIELEDGGRVLIRVVDNGSGIPPDELPLAFASHATSKIRDPEELFHVASLGFRGEALSSIAAVSRARIRSRVAGDDAAVEIGSAAGAVGDPMPAAGPVGTGVEVRDLFFNTPVRRRFLKSSRSEVGRVADWITKLALARPDVAFSLVNDGREVLRWPVQPGLAGRIRQVSGAEIGERLLPVDGQSGAMRLTGFVLPPGHDRPDTRQVFLFVNGRSIRDKAWLAALRESYRGLLMRGRAPIAFLFLTIDPSEVDVNVHPTKEEVRFREPSRLFSLTVKAVREALGRADLRPAVSRARTGTAPENRSEPPVRAGGLDSVARSSRPGPGSAASGLRGFAEPLDAADPLVETAGRVREAAGEERGLDPAWTDEAPRKAVQFLKTYLIEERPGGLQVTDQHALHERVLFEEIRARITGGRLPTQRLLVPEVVKITPRERALIESAQADLDRLGLEVEPYGSDRVAVQGVPELMRRVDPNRLLLDVLAHLDRAAGRGRLEVVITEELMATMACRAAVKAGDVLNDGDIQALLKQGQTVSDSPFCPHGRPVTVTIPVAEIERWFRRNV